MPTNGSVKDYALYAQSASAVRLRPYSANELIETATALFREYGAKLLARTFLSSVYFSGAILFLYSFLVPRSFQTVNPKSVGDQMLEFVLVAVLGTAAAVPLIAFGLSGVMTTCAVLVSSWVHAEEVQWNRIEATVSKHVLKVVLLIIRVGLTVLGATLLGLGLVALSGALVKALGTDSPWPGILTFFGILFAAFGFVYAITALSPRALAVSAMVAEDLGTKAAVERSKFLGKSRNRLEPGVPVGTALNVFIVVTFFVYLGSGTIVGVFPVQSYIEQVAPTLVLKRLLSSLIEIGPLVLGVWITLPFAGILLALSYFDRRSRLEGYDIVEVGKRLGGRR